MTRILRPMFGQASYFFEKYFRADCLLWSVLFMAFCAAVVSATAAGGAEALWKRKHGGESPSFLGAAMAACAALSFPVSNLIQIPFTWVSKLQRVMSNFNYMMTFDSNREIFLGGLGIPDNEYNQARMFRIAMSLGNGEWESVLEKAGGSGWYFEKVRKAIFGVIRMGGQNLTVKPEWIPALLLLALLAIPGIYYILKKNYLCGGVALSCAMLSFVRDLGTGIFSAASLYFCVLIWKILKTKKHTDSGEREQKSIMAIFRRKSTD